MAREGAIRVRVRDVAQLFSAIDPSPIAERDLNDETERFIVTWARDFSSSATLALTVEVSGAGESREVNRQVEDAVHVFFNRRVDTAARDLRALLRRGRTSLVIGLVFLTVCVLTGNFVGSRLHDGQLASVLREGLTVAGWVAMWRPMEIFLYNWWPIAGDRRLYTRLARMPVRIESRSTGDSATENTFAPIHPRSKAST